MFDEKIFSIIANVAKSRAISAEALAAVVEVESNGIAYAKVDGRNVPLIRIEGHYFDRLVPASKQKAARSSSSALMDTANDRNEAIRAMMNETAIEANIPINHLISSPITSTRFCAICVVLWLATSFSEYVQEPDPKTGKKAPALVCD